MTSPEPVAIDLTFTPNRLFWGADDSRLVVAEIGSTNPVTSISIADGHARIDWTQASSEFGDSTVTAVAVAPQHSLWAVAEVMTVPHDPEPFRRLRVLDLADGSQQWFGDYEEADDLALSATEPARLLARTDNRIKIWDITRSDDPDSSPTVVTPSVRPPYRWYQDPTSRSEQIVVGSPPAVLDVTTGDVTPLDLPTAPGQWTWTRIRWTTAETLVVFGIPRYDPREVIIAVLDTGDGALRTSFALDTTARSGSYEWHDIAVSPNGQRLAYAAGDKLELLTLPDLTPAATVPLARGADTVHGRRVCFAPDNVTVAVNGTRSGAGLTLVDAATAECRWQHAGDVSDIAFSPSGRLIAVREGSRISCYDVAAVGAASWTRRKHWPLPGIPRAMAMATIQPARKRPWTQLGAVGSHETGGGLEYFRRVDNDEGEWKSNPSAMPKGLAFGTDHYVVWHAGGENEMVWRSLHHEHMKSRPEGRATTAAAFVTGRRLVAVRGDTQVRFYDTDQDEPDAVRLGGAVQLVAVAPDASTIAVAGYHQTWLLDSTGALMHDEPIATTGNVTALAFDREPLRLLIAHKAAAVACVDPGTGTVLPDLAHPAPVDHAVVSPREHLVATVYRQDVRSTVRITRLSAATGDDQQEREFRSDHPIANVAFHPQERVLAVATEEPHLILYDLDDGSEFWWVPLPAPVRDIMFSADGNVLAIACDDGIHFYGRRGQ